MSFDRGREGQDGTSGEAGGTTGVAPGKRAATERLPAVQRREVPAGGAGAAPAGEAAPHEDPYSVHLAAQEGIAGGGGALPHLDRIQASFGAHDVSGVEAHVGGAAATASAQMGAEAYATGNHVAFAGAPDLHTAAHEAAHVVQQQQGVQLYGGVGQAGDAYERQADAVADRVVAGEPAADLLGAPTAGSGGGGVQRKEKDTLGTAGEVYATAMGWAGPQGAAEFGAEIGTDANIAEAGTDPTKDRAQAFRTAVASGVVADIETTFKAMHSGDRKKLRDETDTILRMMQVWGPPSMKALDKIGVHFADDPRWGRHILWQANVADWKAQMSNSQWKQFIRAEPRGNALDDLEIAGLNQAMKVTDGNANTREIFNRVYPQLQTNKALVEDDWTKAKTEPWTDDRVTRLFDILATGGMPRAHVMAASGGFLLVSQTREREDTADPWGKWKEQRFAYWDDTNNLIVLPKWSADDASATTHSMVGGDNARSHTPVSKLSHFQSSAMHEVGHAVGDNIRGHSWAQTTGPAQFKQVGAADLVTLWDSAKNVPAPAGDTALSEADAKTFMSTELATGTGTLPATGWTKETLERMLGIQYFEQVLYKVWRGTKAKDEAFRAPVEHGGFYYAFMSRWDDQVGRYTKAAFEEKVSMYSMSSPAEWFAEQYTQYYRTNKVGTGMHADTIAYMADIDTRTVAAPGADPAVPAGPASPGADAEGGEEVAAAPTGGGDVEKAGDNKKEGRKRPHRRTFAWAW